MTGAYASCCDPAQPMLSVQPDTAASRAAPYPTAGGINISGQGTAARIEGRLITEKDRSIHAAGQDSAPASATLRAEGLHELMSFPASDPQLSFAPWTSGAPVVVRVSGELDLRTVDILEPVLGGSAAAGTGLVMDLSDLRFCDCAGLSMFIRLARVHAAASGGLRLAAPRGIVRKVLAVLHIDDTIPIYLTRDAAIRGDDVDRLGHDRGDVEGTPPAGIGVIA